MVFSSLGKAKMGKFASKTSWKSFLKHFDHKWCMASRLKIKYSFRMSKSQQSISQPLSIIQHLLHLCELDNIGILPLHQNQQDVIPFWYLSRNFSIKSKCISLVNHYSCFKSDANLLPRQNASYLEFDVCGRKYRRINNPLAEMKRQKIWSQYLGRSRSTRSGHWRNSPHAFVSIQW